MSDLQLDDAGDVEVVGNDLVLTTGVDAIKQHLKQRLQTFLEEWFLDKRIGIAYYQYILKKNPDAIIVDSLLKSEIVNTPGITELTRFSLDLDASTRILTVAFSAKSTEGPINFSEVIP